MSDQELLAALTDPCLRAAVERIIAERDTLQIVLRGYADDALRLSREYEQMAAEREEARRMAADYRWQWVEEDDDPEEWDRWAYRSGKPEWLQPPQWFIAKYPWMRKPDEHP